MPRPYAKAIQALVRDLLATRDGTTYVFGRTSGPSIRYDLGSEHPLVSRNAPDLNLEIGTSLGDLMQDGRGVTLDFSTDRHRHTPQCAGRAGCVTSSTRQGTTSA